MEKQANAKSVNKTSDDDAEGTDALSFLQEQHEELDELLEKIEKAKTPETRKSYFVEMADLLAAHSTIEEKIFYPGVKDKKTEDMLLEAAEEHLSVKRVLADMLAMKVTDEHFDAKLATLKEQLSHHAHEEEEEKLFPIVRKLLSKEQLEEMGDEMSDMYDELIEGDPRKSVPSETKTAAPI